MSRRVVFTQTLAFYLVVVVICLLLAFVPGSPLNAHQRDSATGMACAFSFFAIRAVLRSLRDADELQRRVELESASISAILTGALFMSFGLLQHDKVITIPAEVAMFWVLPTLCLCYGIAKLFLARRYYL